MSNVFQLGNQQFPAMFKSPPGENNGSRGGIGTGASPTGQKVVCTPEVSLYQYTSPEMAAAASAGGGSLQRILEEKGILSAEANNPGHGANNNPGGPDVMMNGGSNGAGGFQCGFCGKTFQQKNTFQNHLRSHREGDDPYQCDICGKTFAVPARLTRHYRTHTGEKPYQCEYCNKSFSVKENLSVHRRIHTKERPYKCEVCERAFEHSGKLHRHMRIHTGERPHRCQICQKTFIQSGQLVIHMRTHTGEKPYVCKVCGKGFTCSKQLKVHTRTHTGEKPYTCDICGKSFGYNHVLKLHQVAHYGEKVYKCTLCNGTFNSKKSLETHIKTHAGEEVPPGPGSPTINPEPRVLSPSTMSQATPQSQNSDKENRECSDSELSSQNSPSSSNDGPKTPPSPSMLSSYPLPPTASTTAPGNIVYPPHRVLHNMGGVPPPEHKLGGGFTRMSSDGPNTTGSNSCNLNTSSSSQDKTCSALPIPYPMLPPGVQIQQAPHGRTTFLYVTSKLPSHPASLNGGGSNSPSSISPPPQSPPSGRAASSHHPPGNNNGFTGLNNNSSTNNAGSGNSANAKNFVNGTEQKNGEVGGGNGRNKLLMHKIREKVLQFTEKYGYGLSPAEVQQQQQNAQKRFNENSSSPGSMRFTASASSGVSVHPIMVPENLSFTHLNSNNNGKDYPDNVMYHQNRLRQIEQSSVKRERSRSPELNVPDERPQPTSYTPGGVLALALTKGSKAVAAAAAAAASNNNNNGNHHHLHHLRHNIPAKVSLIPVTMPNNTSSTNTSSSNGFFSNYHSNLHVPQQPLSRLSPRSSSPGSPVDFHHHLQLQQQLQQSHHQFYAKGPGSVSPTRNSEHSPSPNSTPRSTPSLQEDFSDPDTQITIKPLSSNSSNSGELSCDENSSTSNSSSGVDVGGGLKRARSPNSNSSGGGPRKRSSLILEKYAMENPATPAIGNATMPQANSESILSQRLRLSSVIQYAEKCS